MSRNILVAGGAGFIGSHVAKMLAQQGFQPIIFDNFSQGNRKSITHGTVIEGDLAHTPDIEKAFTEHKIDAVMHFAALIDVGESVVQPAKYYLNNVTNTLHLLEAMRRHHVKTFIFSSSAAIFGVPTQKLINEHHACAPINPYGHTKLIVERMLRDYEDAYGIKSCSLRYFNAAGGDPEGQIKNHKTREVNLIPIILRTLKRTSDNTLTIFGTDYPTHDGTCIRDYIHVEDLGTAHILALKRLLDGGNSMNYNLGNGNGFTVREVIKAVEAITGYQVNVSNGLRRAGDPPFLVADATKARNELGWQPKYPSLEAMISHAWQALH